MHERTILRNSAASLLCKLTLITSAFIVQRCMAAALGQANLGLNSVFNNIISILSLAELGISTAIVYNLYAPLEKHDEATLRSLMHLYARAYWIIAAAVALLGLVLMPIVHVFLKDNSFSLSYIRGMFALFVLRSVTSYFFAYKRSLIIADQKTYLINWVDLGTQLISLLGSIVILRKTGSFALYMLWLTLIALPGNFIASWLTKRLYPFLRAPAEKLDPAVRRHVTDNIKNVFLMRVSGVILNSTDNLVISTFTGILAASVYDAYAQIYSALMSIVSAVSSAIQPTLGHMVVSESHERLDKVLRSYSFVFYLGASLCAIGLMSCSSAFVTQVWLDGRFYMDETAIILLAIDFFLVMLRTPLWSMLNVTGQFRQERNISICGASVNIVVSIALVIPLGISGVLIGTLISQSLQWVLKTRLLYGAVLGLSCRRYCRDIALYTALVILQGAAGYWLLPAGGFAVRFFGCVAGVTALNALVFLPTKRMKEAVRFFKNAGGRKPE